MKPTGLLSFLFIPSVFVPIAAGCGRPAAIARVPAAKPPVKAGWSYAIITGHGISTSNVGLNQPWPDGQADIYVTTKTSRIPWISDIKSSGYWEVTYRWNGPKPPPAPRYQITMGIDVEVSPLGQNALAGVYIDPPNGKSMPRKLTSWRDQSRNYVASRVQKDDRGYYIRFRSWHVYNEAKQKDRTKPWDADLYLQLDTSDPKPSTLPNTRKTVYYFAEF